MSTRKCQKLWGGRFTKEIDPDFHDLNASIKIDKRLYAEDIEGSIAYANALCKAGLLTEGEVQLIENGFEKIFNEWKANQFVITHQDEDIHSANERRLTELIGDVAKKLHTGRSRNDQAITDTRLYLRKSIDKLYLRIINFIETMINRAEKDNDIIMPGYTHMQRAQPIKWSHWLLSYAWYAKADLERLQEIRKRVNILPLGSGAIAGNPFKIDRKFLANNLDFEDVTFNSMYAVSDRDFVAEFLFWSSLTMIHLSRLAEDLIIYNTNEFGFVQFSDEFSTGSSLMPQKRNPDLMELIRGKSGTLLGKCIGFMTTLKGIPSTYNKDLQEDKEALFSAIDTLNSIFLIIEKALGSLTINKEKCRDALTTDMLATDLAYYLVRKGLPFREAHHLAGKVVTCAESEEIPLCEMPLEKLQKISRIFEKDVHCIWDFKRSVEQYDVIGGTSSLALSQQIDSIRLWLRESFVESIGANESHENVD
ncbi:PREDICTED: argininosuccinate lyase isoform X1 [Polistes canadensis]|uniref:argininosuccinate lyase isoform X1 n=1 Tax=Polistes canadensis TaxID=91411 RepID=UPI000718CC47|nr:PREDICTED: argininosuccinate lyase isoform X1 [Polistes canadensis]